MKAPIINPIERQRNRIAYFVYYYPVFYEKYGMRGPIPEMILPYAKKLKQYPKK